MIPLKNLHINNPHNFKPKSIQKSKENLGRENCNLNVSSKSLLLTPDDKYSQDSYSIETLEKSLAFAEQASKNQQSKDSPIPKGNSAYSKGKRYEITRNLEMAEKYYRMAIKNGERLESAIKDLATVMHQQGKTNEACEFLERNKSSYKGDMVKYENLLNNLRKQLIPSGNCLNKTLLLFDVSEDFNEEKLRKLFKNNSRILGVEFSHTISIEDIEQASLFSSSSTTTPSNLLNNRDLKKKKYRSCLMGFASYSAAKKTMETIIDPEKYKFYWMNVFGEVVGPYLSEQKLISTSICEKDFNNGSDRSSPIDKMMILGCNSKNFSYKSDEKVDDIRITNSFLEKGKPIERKINFDTEELLNHWEYKAFIGREALNSSESDLDKEKSFDEEKISTYPNKHDTQAEVSADIVLTDNQWAKPLKKYSGNFKTFEELMNKDLNTQSNSISSSNKINIQQRIEYQVTPAKKFVHAQTQTSPASHEKSTHPYTKLLMAESKDIIKRLVVDNLPEFKRNLIKVKDYESIPDLNHTEFDKDKIYNDNLSKFSYDDHIFSKFFPFLDKIYPKTTSASSSSTSTSATITTATFQNNINHTQIRKCESNENFYNNMNRNLHMNAHCEMTTMNFSNMMAPSSTQQQQHFDQYIHPNNSFQIISGTQEFKYNNNRYSRLFNIQFNQFLGNVNTQLDPSVCRWNHAISNNNNTNKQYKPDLISYENLNQKSRKHNNNYINSHNQSNNANYNNHFQLLYF